MSLFARCFAASVFTFSLLAHTQTLSSTSTAATATPAATAAAPETSATSPPVTPRLTFDVATIRISDPDGPAGGYLKALPGGHGYTGNRIPLIVIIAGMYRVPVSTISGGPSWMNTDYFDIEARVGGSYDLDQLHIMMRNLLADRFNLKFHIDTREGNVYALMVEKSGCKMKLNPDPEDFAIPVNYTGEGKITGRRVSMNYLAFWFGLLLNRDHRPVVDLTGLPGFYDFTLEFLPPTSPELAKEGPPPALADRPSIFQAVREQLGLRLVPQKGPISYYVIDRLDHPTPN